MCQRPSFLSAASKGSAIRPLALPPLPPSVCNGSCRRRCRRLRKGSRLASPARPRQADIAAVTPSRTGAWTDLHSSTTAADVWGSRCVWHGHRARKMATQPAPGGWWHPG